MSWKQTLKHVPTLNAFVSAVLKDIPNADIDAVREYYWCGYTVEEAVAQVPLKKSRATAADVSGWPVRS